VFRKVGTYKSDAGESPKRKNTLKTRRKLEIKKKFKKFFKSLLVITTVNRIVLLFYSCAEEVRTSQKLSFIFTCVRAILNFQHV